MAALKALYPAAAYKRSFHNLTTADMEKLTKILSHQPSPFHPLSSSTQTKYRELTMEDIEKLPPHLKKEPGQEKDLCKMHAGLNSSFIARIFDWVHYQVDITLPRCLSAPMYADIDIPDQVLHPFLHLMKINKMWTPPPSEGIPHRRQSNKVKRWAFQSDGCRACVLARLGGEEDILIPLRASVLAKLSAEDRPKSRRLIWLAQSISGCFIVDDAIKIFKKSDSLGRALRRANKAAAAKRAKHAVYWSPDTRVSDDAHIADVVNEVRLVSDEITRGERIIRERFQTWQQQQFEAKMKEKARSVSPLYEIDTRGSKTESAPSPEDPPKAISLPSNRNFKTIPRRWLTPPPTTNPAPLEGEEEDSHASLFASIDSAYNSFLPTSTLSSSPPLIPLQPRAPIPSSTPAPLSSHPWMPFLEPRPAPTPPRRAQPKPPVPPKKPPPVPAKAIASLKTHMPPKHTTLPRLDTRELPPSDQLLPPRPQSLGKMSAASSIYSTATFDTSSSTFGFSLPNPQPSACMDLSSKEMGEKYPLSPPQGRDKTVNEPPNHPPPLAPPRAPFMMEGRNRSASSSISSRATNRNTTDLQIHSSLLRPPFAMGHKIRSPSSSMSSQATINTTRSATTKTSSTANSAYQHTGAGSAPSSMSKGFGPLYLIGRPREVSRPKPEEYRELIEGEEKEFLESPENI